jgi:hypothetical protein
MVPPLSPSLHWTLTSGMSLVPTPMVTNAVGVVCVEVKVYLCNVVVEVSM